MTKEKEYCSLHAENHGDCLAEGVSESTEECTCGVSDLPECKECCSDDSNGKAIDKDLVNSLLSDALRALCLTRDYVGEEILPALEGWEWYEAGKKIADYLDNDNWPGEFRKRVNRYESMEVRKYFFIGDWVYGIGEHKGCSAVFEGTNCDYQPFSYLNDFNPCNFRIATPEEIAIAKN